AALELVYQARPGREARELLSTAHVCLHALLPRAARRVRAAGAHLHRRLRLLLLLLGELARPFTPLRRGDVAALRSRREEPGGGNRLERRLSAAVLRAARRAGARHRAGGELRR